MMNFKRWMLFVLFTALKVASQMAPFRLTFDEPRFQDTGNQGRVSDPVSGFNLGDFSVIQTQDLPETANPGDLPMSFLRPCSPKNYLVRTSPTLQNNIESDAGTEIKIAQDGTGATEFDSFDLTELCLGCALIFALMQGAPLTEALGPDRVSRVALPQSCRIEIVGSYAGSSARISQTFTFTAKAVADAAKPLTLNTTPMTRFQFGPQWKGLTQLRFRVVGMPTLPLPIDLGNVQQVTGAVGSFGSVVIDDFTGVKNGVRVNSPVKMRRMVRG